MQGVVLCDITKRDVLFNTLPVQNGVALHENAALYQLPKRAPFVLGANEAKRSHQFRDSNSSSFSNTIFT